MIWMSTAVCVAEVAAATSAGQGGEIPLSIGDSILSAPFTMHKMGSPA